MAENQKEKLSSEQIKQRDQINFILEKASNSGKGITEIMVNLDKKSYYFRHVVSIPLKQSFISFIKSQFGVDIIRELANINTPQDRNEIDLKAKNDLLEKEISQLRKELAEARKEQIELLKKNK